MKITTKQNNYVIVFEDKDSKGRVRGAIGFQISLDGHLIVYMKGYKVNAKKFPGLKGYYGYQLTDAEIDELDKFFGLKITKHGVPDMKPLDKKESD